MADQEHWLVGQSAPKGDGNEKATGDLLYVEDMVLPGMLYGKILRSPHAHAKIKKIDSSKASALPGVRAIITAEDTPKIKFSYNAGEEDNLPLADGIVRFIGDEIAAVAAVSPEIAEQALDLFQVEYEVLPGYFTPEEALQEGSLLIHEDRPKNIAFELHTLHGDVDKAFAEATYIYEDTFATSKQAHCCLELRGCIAQMDQAGKVSIYSQTQTPHTLRKEMAKVMGIAVSDVRVIRMPIGGGFGNRLVMDMKEPIAAFLSKKTKQPVQIVNTRQEEFMTARPRYPYTITLKTALNKEGKIIGRHCTAIVDNGAYSDKGPNTMKYCENVNSCFYEVPSTKFDGMIVYTNKQYGTGFRGFGNPQITFAIESQMDLLADRMGMDPISFRTLNANKKGDVTSNGKTIDTVSFAETLEQATTKANFAKKRKEYANQPKDSKKLRGIGFGCILQSGGGSRGYGMNATDAFIKIAEDGTVTVITPAVEMGQGPRTVLAQIAGEVLGVPMRSIRIIDNDTDIIPYDLGAFGSRTTFVHGLAVKDAAENTKSELLEMAALKFNQPAEQLTIKDGKVGPFDQWDKAVSIADIAKYAVSQIGTLISGKGRHFDPEAAQFARGEGSHNFPNLVYGCQVAEVEVDTETGLVKVLKITAAHDAGRAINPRGVEGQIEGGIAQGIGYALTEGLMESEGRTLNPSFLDYKILSSPDIPEMDIIIIQDLDNNGPFAAKGVGEAGIVPTAAAIASAVQNAIGVRIHDLPLKPEKILSALGKL